MKKISTVLLTLLLTIFLLPVGSVFGDEHSDTDTLPFQINVAGNICINLSNIKEFVDSSATYNWDTNTLYLNNLNLSSSEQLYFAYPTTNININFSGINNIYISKRLIDVYYVDDIPYSFNLIIEPDSELNITTKSTSYISFGFTYPISESFQSYLDTNNFELYKSTISGGITINTYRLNIGTGNTLSYKAPSASKYSILIGSDKYECPVGSSFTFPDFPSTSEGEYLYYYDSDNNKYYPGDSITPESDLTFSIYLKSFIKVNIYKSYKNQLEDGTYESGWDIYYQSTDTYSVDLPIFDSSLYSSGSKPYCYNTEKDGSGSTYYPGYDVDGDLTLYICSTSTSVVTDTNSFIILFALLIIFVPILLKNE